MRDKIAEIVDVHALGSDDGFVINSPRVADAIIAALPDMVKPLQWEPLASEVYRSGDYHAYHTGCAFGGKLRYAWGYGPSIRFGVETLEEAKAAAQAHHVVQALAPFGITPPDAGKEG